MNVASLPLVPRLAVTGSGAAVAVTAFAVVGVLLGAAPTAPTPVSVGVGAVLVAALVPTVRRRALAWAERRWLGQSATAIAELAARDLRLDVLEPGHRLATTVRDHVGCASVRLATPAWDAVVGTEEAFRHAVDVLDAGRLVGRVELTARRRWTPGRRAVVERLAATVAPAVANATTVAVLERERAELEQLVEDVTSRRREMVRAESRERRRVAAGVVADADRVFDALRSSIEDGDHEAAAARCEELVELLRGWSTRIRET